uniref:Uncharacterized protein n=1 Tax=Oryza brachyantha TaxID=4533 RepID=J3LJS6_ORYBR
MSHPTDIEDLESKIQSHCIGGEQQIPSVFYLLLFHQGSSYSKEPSCMKRQLQNENPLIYIALEAIQQLCIMLLSGCSNHQRYLANPQVVQIPRHPVWCYTPLQLLKRANRVEVMHPIVISQR